MKTYFKSDQVQIWKQLKNSGRLRRLSSLICFLVMATLFVYSCSDNGSAPTSSDPARGNNSGDPIEFSSDRVDPFDTVEIEGLPSNLNESDVWAEIIIEGLEEQIQTIVYRDNGEWLLRVPFHPLNPMEGGQVQIYITDGEQYITGQAEFFINPMNPAPGAFGEFVDSLSKLFDSYLSLAGITRRDLDEVNSGQESDIRAALFIAYDLIDRPENENSLRAIANGTSPLLAEFPIEKEVLNAMIFHMKLPDLIRVTQANVDTLEQFAAKKQPTKNQYLKDALTAQKSGPIEVQELELSQMMWTQQAAKNMNTETHQDIINTAGQGLGVIGILAPIPPVKIGVGAASAGLLSWGVMVDAVANTYPSKFLNTDNDFSVDPVDFPEDAEWGTWKLKPIAESNGWSVDKAILSGLVQIVGARGVKNMTGKFGQAISKIMNDNVADFLLTDRLNSVINTVLTNPGDGLIKIPPKQWTSDVTIVSTISVVEGNAVEQHSVFHDRIVPKSIGTARLRAEKMEGLFAYQALLRFKNVEVHEIIVSIDPPISFAAPKSKVPLNATIQFAEDESLKWSVSNGVLESFDGKNNTLYTPDVPWDKPIRVEAESMTRTSLREDGEPPRVGVALVYTDDVDLIITPGGACIDPGDRITFQAEIEGFDGDLDIHWSASSGTFNDNVYTAPGSTVGIVTITASIKGTDIVEKIGIKVGGCVCSWNATFSGDLGGTASGTYAAYEDFFSPQTFTNFTFRPEPEKDIPNFFMNELSIVGDRDTGSRYTSVIFVDTSNDFNWVSPVAPFASPPINTINVNTGSLISGNVAGTIVKIVPKGEFEEPDIFTAGFTLEYTARKKTAGNPEPCE